MPIANQQDESCRGKAVPMVRTSSARRPSCCSSGPVPAVLGDLLPSSRTRPAPTDAPRPVPLEAQPYLFLGVRNDQMGSCTAATMVFLYRQTAVRLNLACLLRYFDFLSFGLCHGCAGGTGLVQGPQRSRVFSRAAYPEACRPEQLCCAQAIEGNVFLPLFFFFVS